MFVRHCVASVHVMGIEMQREMIGFATYVHILATRPIDLAGKRYTEQRL